MEDILNDSIKIKRDMKRVNLRVTPEKYESLPEYLKKYCNTDVYTIKNITRIHGCGANHGTCKLCGKNTSHTIKHKHKERKEKKQYSKDDLE